MKEPRKMGLNQVYPDPINTDETFKKTVDVIAIHGLDTDSLKTWSAWKTDTVPHSGDVHWLQDHNMLPSVLPNCRIFTYDWNANIDQDAAAQNLEGHAKKLLDQIKMERSKSGKSRPIIFIGSCFGGLLVVQALLLACETFRNYRDIYYATVDAIFLGTPFQGTHHGFRQAVQLRVDHSRSTGAEVANDLLTFITKVQHNFGNLEQLNERFASMLNNEKHKISITCFYETLESNFIKVFKDLPPEVLKNFKGNGRGILVPKSSACLLGHEHHELSVRHGMLNKFSGPDDDSFKTICYTLERLVANAEGRYRERIRILNPSGMGDILQWIMDGIIKVWHEIPRIFSWRLTLRDGYETP